MTAAWDVFHSERLGVDRALPDAVVRARIAAGNLNPDDLIRPVGTTRWSRIEQVAELAATPAAAEAAPSPPPLALNPVVLAPEPPLELRRKPGPQPDAPLAPEPTSPRIEPTDPDPDATSTIEFRPVAAELSSTPVPPIEPAPADESVEAAPVFVPPPVPVPPASPAPAPRAVAPPAPAALDGSAVAPALTVIILPDDEEGGPDPAELGDPEPTALEGPDDAEDDAASDFTLSRAGTEQVEELDLAAMVDVAFQLVLFFLVTASTVVFKTLEVPRPNQDKPPEAAAQSRARTVEELEKDFILVEVDADGGIKVDHQAVAADRAALTEKLRQARESTGRKAMLLATDPATRHRAAVLAYDIASEINLEVGIASPTAQN